MDEVNVRARLNNRPTMIAAKIFVSGLSQATIDAMQKRIAQLREQGIKLVPGTRFHLFDVATKNAAPPAVTVEEYATSVEICDERFWTREESARILGRDISDNTGDDE